MRGTLAAVSVRSATERAGADVGAGTSVDASLTLDASMAGLVGFARPAVRKPSGRLFGRRTDAAPVDFLFAMFDGEDVGPASSFRF